MKVYFETPGFLGDPILVENTSKEIFGTTHPKFSSMKNFIVLVERAYFHENEYAVRVISKFRLSEKEDHVVADWNGLNLLHILLSVQSLPIAPNMRSNRSEKKHDPNLKPDFLWSDKIVKSLDESCTGVFENHKSLGICATDDTAFETLMESNWLTLQSDICLTCVALSVPMTYVLRKSNRTPQIYVYVYLSAVCPSNHRNIKIEDHLLLPSGIIQSSFSTQVKNSGGESINMNPIILYPHLVGLKSAEDTDVMSLTSPLETTHVQRLNSSTDPDVACKIHNGLFCAENLSLAYMENMMTAFFEEDKIDDCFADYPNGKNEGGIRDFLMPNLLPLMVYDNFMSRLFQKFGKLRSDSDVSNLLNHMAKILQAGFLADFRHGKKTKQTSTSPAGILQITIPLTSEVMLKNPLQMCRLMFRAFARSLAVMIPEGNLRTYSAIAAIARTVYTDQFLDKRLPTRNQNNTQLYLEKANLPVMNSLVDVQFLVPPSTYTEASYESKGAKLPNFLSKLVSISNLSTRSCQSARSSTVFESVKTAARLCLDASTIPHPFETMQVFTQVWITNMKQWIFATQNVTKKQTPGVIDAEEKVDDETDVVKKNEALDGKKEKKEKEREKNVILYMQRVWQDELKRNVFSNFLDSNHDVTNSLFPETRNHEESKKIKHKDFLLQEMKEKCCFNPQNNMVESMSTMMFIATCLCGTICYEGDVSHEKYLAIYRHILTNGNLLENQSSTKEYVLDMYPDAQPPKTKRQYFGFATQYQVSHVSFCGYATF